MQFLFAAMQLLGADDVRIAERANVAMQLRQRNFPNSKLQRNFCVRMWHVAGWGFRGVGQDMLTKVGPQRRVWALPPPEFCGTFGLLQEVSAGGFAL